MNTASVFTPDEQRQLGEMTPEIRWQELAMRRPTWDGQAIPPDIRGKSGLPPARNTLYQYLQWEKRKADEFAALEQRHANIIAMSNKPKETRAKIAELERSDFNRVLVESKAGGITREHIRGFERQQLIEQLRAEEGEYAAATTGGVLGKINEEINVVEIEINRLAGHRDEVIRRTLVEEAGTRLTGLYLQKIAELKAVTIALAGIGRSTGAAGGFKPIMEGVEISFKNFGLNGMTSDKLSFKLDAQTLDGAAESWNRLGTAWKSDPTIDPGTILNARR
jgi:hypothetical protein